jgi:hypothetical protein
MQELGIDLLYSKKLMVWEENEVSMNEARYPVLEMPQKIRE